MKFEKKLNKLFEKKLYKFVTKHYLFDQRIFHTHSSSVINNRELTNKLAASLSHPWLVVATAHCGLINRELFSGSLIPVVNILVSGASMVARSLMSGSFMSGSLISGTFISGSFMSGSLISGTFMSGSFMSGSFTSGSFTTAGSFVSGSFVSGLTILRALAGSLRSSIVTIIAGAFVV